MTTCLVAGCGTAEVTLDDGGDSVADDLRRVAHACRSSSDGRCCGNGICEVRETCSSCAADCGVCSPQPGTIELAEQSYSVGEGDGVVWVTLTRSGGSDGVVTVDWKTQGSTATWGLDYGNFGWTTLVFADGETDKVESILIHDDELVEPEESFAVLLQNPTGGAALGPRISTTVSILDNDAPTPPSPPATPPPTDELPVFPGALGFGSTTPAGRGGAILEVTNLNDSGPGSLRAAASAAGPRIIVFAVSGTIELLSDIGLASPFVTIAGQSAPSPGITLRNAGLKVQTHDVLVQHLRLRPGDSSVGASPANRDAFQVLGTSSYNVVVDHVSASWAIDENGSTFYPLHDVTVSNCIISEGLANSLHPKGPHSMGFLIGENATRVAFVGNLLAHNNARNPIIMQGSASLVANNVLYNAGAYEFTAVTVSLNYPADSVLLSIVGNVYLKGPNTTATRAIAVSSKLVAAGTQIYQRDNVFAGGTVFSEGVVGDPLVDVPPVWVAGFSAMPSSQVEQQVKARAGARPADRDAVDLRIIHEVTTRTGRHINSPQEVGGWPVLAERYVPFPEPSDPHGDADGDGYTNIEELLFTMAAVVEN